VVKILEEIGSKYVGQSVLEVATGLAVLRKDWPRAARFYGAAEALADQTVLQRDPGDEAFLAPLVARARQELGVAAFEKAEGGGRLAAYAEIVAEGRVWFERG
jgi:hypothetical protein